MKTVFVLGAGFTRSYLPTAPLMAANYDRTGKLENLFGRTANAGHLLRLEKVREAGNLNIERLMTRLQMGMPYDDDLSHRSELDHLFDEVKEAFLEELKMSEMTDLRKADLFEFATYCKETEADCITFNYDDLFDWALYKKSEDHYSPGKTKCWTPHHGYGFECNISEASPTLLSTPMMLEHPPMLLLKLHGSVCWRLKYGHNSPYSPETVQFYASWGKLPGWGYLGMANPLLKREVFIVPPVLMKEDIHREPVLRLVWSGAYKSLKQAKRIIFLGYSFPPTDIAARYLFAEAIDLDAEVHVVVKSRNPARVEAAYRDALPRKHLDFHTDSAADWLKTFMTRS